MCRLQFAFQKLLFGFLRYVIDFLVYFFLSIFSENNPLELRNLK